MEQHLAASTTQGPADRVGQGCGLTCGPRFSAHTNAPNEVEVEWNMQPCGKAASGLLSRPSAWCPHGQRHRRSHRAALHQGRDDYGRFQRRGADCGRPYRRKSVWRNCGAGGSHGSDQRLGLCSKCVGGLRPLSWTVRNVRYRLATAISRRPFRCEDLCVRPKPGRSHRHFGYPKPDARSRVAKRLDLGR